MPIDPSLDGRIMQWPDLTRQGQQITEDNLRAVGQAMPQRVSTAIDKAKTSKSKKAVQTRRALEAVQPHIRPEPVSLQRAANSRQRLFEDARLRRQATTDNPHNVIPEGADWYFEHHARITVDANRLGFPGKQARYASAQMSPMNAPENERAAIRAIMDAHTNRSLQVTPTVSRHLAKKGIDVSEHVGKTVPYSNLPTGVLGELSGPKIWGKVKTDADLENVALGGIKENIHKAEAVALGHIDPDQAIINQKTGAVTASKVGSYSHVIDESVPGSAEHVEFMGRVHHDALVRAGHISPHQQAFDLYGLANKQFPQGHILGPESHTVEDTWQNAVTFNQPKELVGQTSVFKAGGSGAQYPPSGLKVLRDQEGKQIGSAHPDPRVGDAMLLHAFNNRATQKAAEQMGRQTQTQMPPTAVQGAVWTEARRQAGKSREADQPPQLPHEEAQTEVDVYHSMGRMVPQPPVTEAPRGEVPGQQALWGPAVPRRGRRA